MPDLSPKLTSSVRVTRIEAIDVQGQPGQPVVVKIQVTGTEVRPPNSPPSPSPLMNQTWLFDDAPGARDFFDVDETVVVETTFSKPPEA